MRRQPLPAAAAAAQARPGNDPVIDVIVLAYQTDRPSQRPGQLDGLVVGPNNLSTVAVSCSGARTVLVSSHPTRGSCGGSRSDCVVGWRP